MERLNLTEAALFVFGLVLVACAAAALLEWRERRAAIRRERDRCLRQASLFRQHMDALYRAEGMRCAKCGERPGVERRVWPEGVYYAALCDKCWAYARESAGRRLRP